MAAFDSVSQGWRYRLLVVGSLVVSVAGVVLAVYWKHWEDGGRGGALGTAIAFLALYLRPDYGLEFFRAQKAATGKLAGQAQESARLESMEAALRLNSVGQTAQNRALALATVIGTLFWGFGDLLAAHLLRWFQ